MKIRYYIFDGKARLVKNRRDLHHERYYHCPMSALCAGKEQGELARKAVLSEEASAAFFFFVP